VIGHPEVEIEIEEEEGKVMIAEEL